MKYLPLFLRPPYHFLAYNLLHRYRLNRTVATSVNGIGLTIEPSVMHPRVFKSGRIFAEFLAACDLRGKTILDIGTGSGILAITSAKMGSQVVATDIDPRAVACANQNVHRNGCGSSVTVVESDLFDSLGGRKFDMIIFNPPYLANAPEGPYGTAMRGGADLALMKRFAAGALQHLTAAAFLLVLLSSDAPLTSVFSIFSDNGYSTNILYRRSGLFEEFLVCQFAPLQSPHRGSTNA